MLRILSLSNSDVSSFYSEEVQTRIFFFAYYCIIACKFIWIKDEGAQFLFLYFINSWTDNFEEYHWNTITHIYSEATLRIIKLEKKLLYEFKHIFELMKWMVRQYFEIERAYLYFYIKIFCVKTSENIMKIYGIIVLLLRTLQLKNLWHYSSSIV